MLHAICDGMAMSQNSLMSYCIYLLNCDICIVIIEICFPKRENGNYCLIILCVFVLCMCCAIGHNWIVDGCAVKRQFTTKMSSSIECTVKCDS